MNPHRSKVDGPWPGGVANITLPPHMGVWGRFPAAFRSSVALRNTPRFKRNFGVCDLRELLLQNHRPSYTSTGTVMCSAA
jgi:hypothetical protein